VHLCRERNKVSVEQFNEFCNKLGLKIDKLKELIRNAETIKISIVANMIFLIFPDTIFLVVIEVNDKADVCTAQIQEISSGNEQKKAIADIRGIIPIFITGE